MDAGFGHLTDELSESKVITEEQKEDMETLDHLSEASQANELANPETPGPEIPWHE